MMFEFDKDENKPRLIIIGHPGSTRLEKALEYAPIHELTEPLVIKPAWNPTYYIEMDDLGKRKTDKIVKSIPLDDGLIILTKKKVEYAGFKTLKAENYDVIKERLGGDPTQEIYASPYDSVKGYFGNDSRWAFKTGKMGFFVTGRWFEGYENLIEILSYLDSNIRDDRIRLEILELLPRHFQRMRFPKRKKKEIEKEEEVPVKLEKVKEEKVKITKAKTVFDY